MTSTALLRALPRGPASQHSCRHAHLSSSLPSSLNSSSNAPPPPSTCFAAAGPSSEPNPAWSDPSYLARYRNPVNHERPLARPPCSKHTSPPSTSAADCPISTATREDYRKREQERETPRSRRLEMERLWSGGEASPPIPLHSYRVSKSLAKPKHALLFPGSGSQYVGMGHFLQGYAGAKAVWDEAEEALEGFEAWRKGLGLENYEGEVGVLGRMLAEREGERKEETGLKEVVFDGPQDELTRSSNAQPAILITSIAFLRTLEHDFDSRAATDAAFFLGHSSGEYSAAVASGAISFTDGVRLTRLHGLLTSYALDLPSIALSASLHSPSPSRAQMSALVINPGHSHEEVAEIIRSIASPPGSQGSEGKVEVASYNSKAQVVLAGSREGILRASEVLRDLGIASRAADLPVSAPFHCSFMKPAAEGMRVALEQSTLQSPTAPLVSGLDGAFITTPKSLVANLVAQISLPVRWSDCLETLRKEHVNRFLFLGPGKALANLARRDLSNDEGEKAEVVSVATDEDLAGLKGLLEEQRV